MRKLEAKTLKISISHKHVDGPWGGGNSFFSSLTSQLMQAGHTVVNDLSEDDIDFIIIADPRHGRKNRATTFSYKSAWRYIQKSNPNCLIIHRINECDERKNTRTMNRLLKSCNAIADHTVFVGSWLKQLDLWLGEDQMPNSVILNGSDPEIFNHHNFTPWDGKGRLKLVTHHWGGNWMKGFDVYNHIDQMLAHPEWREKVDFTYIGNTPPNYQFRNATHIKPLSGKELADALRENHAYVTGSLNEPGGNHQNEGALCGLPVLYIRSGCLPEYLESYGLEFRDNADFENQLKTLIQNYAFWQKKISFYPHNSHKSCQQWISLLNELSHKKDILLRNRKNKKSAFWQKISRILP